MARDYCALCEKPLSACICRFVSDIDNDIEVVVLQHPKEVNHSKGSASLLARSLDKCHVFVGENFDQHESFSQFLSRHLSSCYVLYPSENAQCVSSIKLTMGADIKPITCLVLIDATWKKAYKMYQLSSILQQLPHLKLPDGISSLYEIRKTKKNNALSTLEACCHGLALLEQNDEKYQTLLNNFVQFNQFQLSFRPANDKTSH